MRDDDRIFQPENSFDPWTSTIEEAVAAQELFSGTLKANGPVMQWGGAKQVKDMLAKHAAGEVIDVLTCIYLCALYRLTLPSWLEDMYVEKYRKVQHAEVGSWDDAFGRPFKLGTQLARARFRKRHRFSLYLVVTELVSSDPDRAIDKGLFEEVGAKFGCEATLAEELYRDVISKGLYPTAFEIKQLMKSPESLENFAGFQAKVARLKFLCSAPSRSRALEGPSIQESSHDDDPSNTSTVG